MNEFGIVDLKVVAKKAIETGDKSLLESCLACSLSPLKLIESVAETRRYELLWLLRDFLHTFFEKATKEQVSNLYLDLLLAGELAHLEYIKSHCSFDVSRLMLKAMARNVDIYTLDSQLCERYSVNYFYALRTSDHLPFFLQHRELFLKKVGRKRLYNQLAQEGALKILAHEAARGEHEQVVKSILESGNLYRESLLALLHSLCVEHDCEQVLTQAFECSQDLHILRLLLRLGARPTAKQKESLLKGNPGVYDELFREDV